MKLNIVPARTGVLWAKQGIRTFLRQPLAMSGLFFLFMASLSIATLFPVIGPAIALALLPAATLGLMAATQQADRGKFPMPIVLASAFREGPQVRKSMLILGSLYALGFLLIMAISSLLDGGDFAKLYLVGGSVSEEVVTQPGFQTAMWVTLVLYLPLSLMFWHAPALVYWHGVSPVKSLFLSMMTCYHNFGAMLLYALFWASLFISAIVVISLIAVLVGEPAIASMAMFPVALMMMAMFFTSIYYTFLDCFEATPDPSKAVASETFPKEML